MVTGGWKLLKSMKTSTFLLFCRNVFFSIFHCPLEATEDTLFCFPEEKLSTIYLDLQIQKDLTPPALNASHFLQEHEWMFEPFLIVVFESLNCPQCENMDLKMIQSLLERVKKWCWNTEEYAGNGGNFWRTVLSNCSEQTRDSWTNITKQKKTLW